MSYNYDDQQSFEYLDEDLLESSEDIYEDEYENDEEVYGGYGIHFDCYSTFDSDNYEYQQSLYL